jgi:fructose-bisphosphate aldolase class II
MAITGAIRKVFAEKPGEFDPRGYLKPAKEAMRRVCIQRYQEFGCEGMAGRITPVPLAAMAKQYAAGKLAPTFTARPAAAE